VWHHILFFSHLFFFFLSNTIYQNVNAIFTATNNAGYTAPNNATLNAIGDARRIKKPPIADAGVDVKQLRSVNASVANVCEKYRDGILERNGTS